MRWRFGGGWTLAWVAVMPWLAACSDPAAVQNFAASAPPAAGFHALMTDYAALPLQRAELDRIALAGTTVSVPASEGDAATQQTARLCAQAVALERMHAAMIAYMSILGDLATSGVGSAGGGARPTAAQPPALGDPCSPLPSSAAAGTPPQDGEPARPAPALGNAPTGSLTSGLEGFASAYPQLGISLAQADAAGSLATLAIDAASLGLREAALRAAFVSGHDGFLAAIHIERSVVSWGLSCMPGAPSDLTDYRDNLSGLLSRLRGYAAANDRRTAALSAWLQLDLLQDRLLPPAQVTAICAAAQNYDAALASLRTAYLTLYQAAIHGTGLLTPAMRTRLQPILGDVQTAYGALRKL